MCSMRFLFALFVASFLVSTGLAQEEDVFLTESGAPLKVVVRHASAIYESPKKAGRNRPVSTFEFFYVLKPDSVSAVSTKDGFYRVAAGTSVRLELGWLPQDDAIEWPHRQALGLRPVAGRQPAEFFKSKADLLSAYGSGPSPTPLSREPKGTTLDINLVPILDRFTLRSDGDEVDGYQVAYLHSRSGRRVGGPATTDGPAIDLSQTTLDVVFVVDTTASMSPHIDAAKRAVAKMATEIARRSKGTRVRFGLVGYRDVGDTYVSKVFSDLEQGADHDRFQRIIETVAAEGGGDDPEDVFAALKTAITQAKWNPHGFKHIILMGDAPAHTESIGLSNSEKLTIGGVVALAQPRGRETIREKITLHAICCHVGAASPLAAEQFRALAAGEEYPGYFGQFNTSESPKFIEDLVLKALSALDTLTASGDIRAIASDTPGLGMLLEMASASESTTTDVPAFASGFCCEVDRGGNQVFEPFVLVQHGRLGMFNAFLEFSVKALRTSGDPGSRDVKQVLQSVQIFATQVSLGEPINADIPLHKIASLILGFPVRSKIFDMTFARLAAMSEADFETWVQHVDASKSIAQSHLGNSRVWRSLGRDVPLEQRYCFIKVKDLP